MQINLTDLTIYNQHNLKMPYIFVKSHYKSLYFLNDYFPHINSRSPVGSPVLSILWDDRVGQLTCGLDDVFLFLNICLSSSAPKLSQPEN